MSLIKTPAEIEILKKGGAILSRALRLAMDACVVGASTVEIDRIAREYIVSKGGEPSFLGYRISPEDPAYPSTLCISINDEVVHGLAIPERIIKDGDVVSLDIGAWYQGLCTDMAATVAVGNVQPRNLELIRDTRTSLEKGIAVVKAGTFVSDIGATVEDFLKPRGYGIVRDLVGHGVGHEVHEEPQIPNFREPRMPKTKMRTGMVLAIEPMITLGDWRVYQKDDGWTIVTKDHSVAAHWEVTVAVTETGYELITPWPDES
ncbi:type I methionyl aminopeptidase [Candidatus Uhrbacteria bacterium]|nr:type I methionyl aminopeptidase [Candidatus Uhrbacteria bacterium]